jgi:hypothetical protein
VKLALIENLLFTIDQIEYDILQVNDPQTQTHCRVCSNLSRLVFEKTLYWGEIVPFFRCGSCGHLQTCLPTWLTQSYQAKYAEEDTGMADRCLWTAQTTVAFALRTDIGPSEPCLDWGTGTGLFVRFCRDAGLNAYGYDPFADALFSREFLCKPDQLDSRWSLITAFEVAEHFSDPSMEFAKMFAMRPSAILFSTLLYQGQGADWWYIVGNGQHVSFYTEQGLRILGERHGYNLTTDGLELHLFSRKKYTPRFLRQVRKKRETWSRKYLRAHGSRLTSDSEAIRSRIIKEESDKLARKE